jgi:hypothetical protein
MVRYLTERLPLLIGPSWIRNQVQPIAVRDTLSYLIHALGSNITGVVEVGGDRVSFRRMLKDYAEARGLKRLILVTKPLLPPRFVASSVGPVTGLPRSLAVALLEGIIHPVLADTTRARKLFPQIAPLSYRVAVDLALKRTRKRMVETHWYGSFLPIGRESRLADPKLELEDMGACRPVDRRSGAAEAPAGRGASRSGRGAGPVEGRGLGNAEIATPARGDEVAR